MGQDRVQVQVEGRLVAVIAASGKLQNLNYLICGCMLFYHVCFWDPLHTHTHTHTHTHLHTSLYLLIRGKERAGTGRNFIVLCVCGAAVCMCAGKTGVCEVKSFSMLQRPVCKSCTSHPNIYIYTYIFNKQDITLSHTHTLWHTLHTLDSDTYQFWLVSLLTLSWGVGRQDLIWTWMFTDFLADFLCDSDCDQQDLARSFYKVCPLLSLSLSLT